MRARRTPPHGLTWDSGLSPTVPRELVDAAYAAAPFLDPGKRRRRGQRFAPTRLRVGKGPVGQASLVIAHSETCPESRNWQCARFVTQDTDWSHHLPELRRQWSNPLDESRRWSTSVEEGVVKPMEAGPHGVMRRQIPRLKIIRLGVAIEVRDHGRRHPPQNGAMSCEHHVVQLMAVALCGNEPRGLCL